MTAISKFICVFAIGVVGHNSSALASNEPTAPVITKVQRSKRSDGVWHDILVSYRGRAKQKLTFIVSWDAHTPAETGHGTVQSKSQKVWTDAHGIGCWKMLVKGYPAGKVIARVRDKKGHLSPASQPCNMPWLY